MSQQQTGPGIRRLWVSRELRLLLSAAIDQLFFFTTTTFQLPGPWTKITLFFTRNINNTNYN